MVKILLVSTYYAVIFYGHFQRTFEQKELNEKNFKFLARFTLSLNSFQKFF